jgi:hypothetical protein
MREGILISVLIVLVRCIVEIVWEGYFSGNAVLIYITDMFIFETILTRDEVRL